MEKNSPIKAIKLLKERNNEIERMHQGLTHELDELKQSLEEFPVEAIKQSEEYHRQLEIEKIRMSSFSSPLEHKGYAEIVQDASILHPNRVVLSDILSDKELAEVDAKFNAWTADFNKEYSLDAWDYAIACSCGVLASMLDILCVQAPLKPTKAFDTKVDGIFNQWTQQLFNKVLPPEKSGLLSKEFEYWTADISTSDKLFNAPKKVLNPWNHRLKELSHDPILGFIFGVKDLMNNTCTVISDGGIQVFKTTIDTSGKPIENVWQSVTRVFYHLCSDVNAPSAKGNRGMGIPAPFMGILRMFEDIPVGGSNFGKQIEWMYVNGYDFRQFVTASIPVTIMEVLLRVAWVAKECHCNNAAFGQTMVSTMPTMLTKRFRMILSLAYGSFCAVNAGRVYVTQNILNANYTAWSGFAWNTFFALKWVLLDRPVAWEKYIDQTIYNELSESLKKIEQLEIKAEKLPY